MIIKASNYFLILAAAAFLLSCGRNVVFTDSAAMKAKTWELADIPVFKIPVKDTISGNNISFTIRTGSAYPYRNLYLFVTTTSPRGKSITDTLQYNIADEKGNWLGKGFGDIHELVLPYKSNVFFPVKGNYMIAVQHGMRIESLKGVYDLGIRVEKAGKQSLRSGKK
jgi:gliding motility-associated lipoprotein GldH